MDSIVYKIELIESSAECEMLLKEARRSLHSLEMGRVNAALQPIKDQRGSKDSDSETQRLNLKIQALKNSDAEQKFINKAIKRIKSQIQSLKNSQLSDLHPKYKFKERLIDSQISEYQLYIDTLVKRLTQLKRSGL